MAAVTTETNDSGNPALGSKAASRPVRGDVAALDDRRRDGDQDAVPAPRARRRRGVGLGVGDRSRSRSISAAATRTRPSRSPAGSGWRASPRSSSASSSPSTPAARRCSASCTRSCEGFCLGAISAVFDAQTDGIVAAAILSTVAVFIVALFLYVTRIVKPTQKLAFACDRRDRRPLALVPVRLGAVDLRLGLPVLRPVPHHRDRRDRDRGRPRRAVADARLRVHRGLRRRRRAEVHGVVRRATA